MAQRHRVKAAGVNGASHGRVLLRYRVNLKTCGFEARAACHGRDFAAFLSRAGEKYGLIFLDPPYASGNLERALEMIAAIDIVVENGIIVCESPADHTLPDLPAPYEKGREYRCGFFCTTLSAAGALSTKSQNAAPRLSASIPATLEELAAVVPKNTAQAVYVHFHPAENQQRKDGAP